MIRSDVRLSTPSHHSAVANTVCCFEGHFADRAVVGTARIGIGNGIGVDGGTMRMGFLTSNMLMFVERVLKHWHGFLDGNALDFLNGNFDLEGLHDSTDILNFGGNIDFNLLDVGSWDLYFIWLVDHFGILDLARNLLLVAFILDFHDRVWCCRSAVA